MGGVKMAKERNIVLCIIFSIITCGIYGLYWLAKLNDEAKDSANDTSGFSGGVVVLLSIVTCGIYQYYWFFKIGKIMNTAGDCKGVSIEDRSITYLIVGILGFGIVNYCLIQNDLNNIARSNSFDKF